MAPTVSVNLCCHNSERYLEETLGSVFSQTFTDWELIIVNDGSTDSTEQMVLRHVSAGRPIVYHPQPNAGLGASRRRAVELSSGRYVAFIDHDDLWMPEKLAAQIRMFEANPALGLVYCDGMLIDGSGRAVRWYSSQYPLHRGDVFAAFLRSYFIVPVAAMVPRQILAAAAPFPDFQSVEDYHTFLQIAYAHPVDYVDAPMFKYRIHGESLTNTGNPEVRHRENLAIREYWVERLTRESPPRARLGREVAATAHAGYARWLLDQGRHAEARRHFARSLSLNPWQHRYLHWTLSTLPPPLGARLLRATSAAAQWMSELVRA